MNWIAAKRLTVFGENELIRLGAAAFARYDNLARIGVNAIHPRGLFVRITGSHVLQRFADTRISGLPWSNFVVADLEINYEIAGKRGLAGLQLTNVRPPVRHCD